VWTGDARDTRPGAADSRAAQSRQQAQAFLAKVNGAAFADDNQRALLTNIPLPPTLNREEGRYVPEPQLHAAWLLHARRARGGARPDDDDARRRDGERPLSDDARAPVMGASGG